MAEPTLKAENGVLTIRIPMEFRRRSGRKEIIVPEGVAPPPAPGHTHGPLAVAVARAHAWKGMIESGRFASVSNLAEHMGVNHRHVGRMLDLTLLAPDIIEAILAGEEPSGLSLRTFARGVPLLWEEQRRRFGFLSEHKS